MRVNPSKLRGLAQAFSEDSKKEDPGSPIAEDSEHEDPGSPIAKDSEHEDPGSPIAEDSEIEDPGSPIAEDSEKEDPGSLIAEDSDQLVEDLKLGLRGRGQQLIDHRAGECRESLEQLPRSRGIGHGR